MHPENAGTLPGLVAGPDAGESTRPSAAAGVSIADTPTAPSKFYRSGLWSAGLGLVRLLPEAVSAALCRLGAAIYWHVAPRRRQVVTENLLPVVNGEVRHARRLARRLFTQFTLKLADLWRFEAGVDTADRFLDLNGWEAFAAAQARGRGVLLVTPHLGNWELGGPLLSTRGVRLLVITQPEPGEGFTELRQASRARWGIETLVIGRDAFAFLEVIKRLQAGATVAILVDRPPPPGAVTIELFGRPFAASIAAAELARATGCAVLGVHVVRSGRGYAAQVLPEFLYDRQALGSREGRIAFTQEILTTFEPVIRAHADQWYHFVPVWRPPAPPRS